MAPDPSVISALEAALATDPGNAAVRLHLAGLLAEAHREADAWGHVEQVLRDRPDDVGALRLAATVCPDVDRAAGYRRLADAMSPDRTSSDTTTQPPDGAATQQPAALPAAGPQSPDTVDELLAQWETSEPITEPEIGALLRPDLRLRDVGGMAAVKDRLETSFLGPLRHPELRAQFGKSLAGGLLLWGPPGCGKTYIARALAGELGASFYTVGLNDVLDMWIGASERNLHSIFEVAREHAPCVLFFDEIDALGHRRANLGPGGGAMRGVVNQFLTELDGVSRRNNAVFVLGATNHPWDVDEALLRPGRFDRTLFVEPPDRAARHDILAAHLRERPTEGLDLDRVAAATAGLSAADLALICDDATERALADSMRDGRVRPIAQKDLLAGAKATRTSIKPWLDSAKNYVTFSNSSGRYDELDTYLKRRHD